MPPAIYAFDADSGRLVWKTDPDRRRGQAHSPAGRGQGAAGRHRRSGAPLRRQDRQAGRHLARLGQVRGLRPRPAGREPDLLADPDRDPGPRPGLRPARRAADQADGDLPDDRRQPGGRRRLPDRRAARRPGRLLPEQPADRALSRRDRPEPGARGDTITGWPRPPRRSAATSWRWNRTTRRRRRRRTGRDASTASPWPRRHATTSSGCSCGWRRRPGATRMDGAATSGLETAVADRPIRPRPAGARLLLAEVQTRGATGRPRRSTFSSRSLTDDRLRGLTVSTEDGHRTIRADLLIADRLAEIVKQRGRSIYDASDRSARELFDRGRREQDPGCSRRSAGTTRWPRSCPRRCWHWARFTREPAGRPPPPRRTSGCSPSAAAPDVARARGLWRLAHVYEAQNYLVSARDAYLQIQARYPRIKLPGAATGRPAGRPGLGRSSPAAAGADRAGPSPGTGAAALGAALARAVAERLATSGFSRPSGRLRGCSRAAPSWSKGPVLTPLDPATGEPRWIGRPGMRPGLGRLPLGQGDGGLGPAGRWLSTRRPGRSNGGSPPACLPGRASRRRSVRPTPIRPRAARQARRAAHVHDFHLVGGRLFCLRGDDELIAIDGESGARRLVVHLDGRHDQSETLDRPGACRRAGPEPQPACWCSRPRAGGRSRGLRWPTERLWSGARCRSTTIMCCWCRTGARSRSSTSSRGQFTWDYRESAEMPVNGPPRVLVDAERVLVLHDGRLLIRLDPVTGVEAVVVGAGHSRT